MGKNLVRIVILAVSAALWITLFSAAGTANAQSPQPTPSDDEVNQVAKQLYCPVCENIPLDVCPTTACQDWREEIRAKLALGWDTEQIRAYFALQYGDRVLSEPPLRGLNWLIYVLPPVFILAGLAVVVQVLRRMKSRRIMPVEAEPPTQSALEPDADDYLARVEEEIRRTERS